MKKPVPVKAIVTTAVRTISGEGNELNISCRMAQKSDKAKICTRGRNPPASMRGNRYRSPSETYRLVAQSMSAIVKIRITASVSDLARFFGAKANGKSTNGPYTPEGFAR